MRGGILFSMTFVAVLVIYTISASPNDVRQQQQQQHPMSPTYHPENLGHPPPPMSSYPPFPLHRRQPRYKRAYHKLRRLFNKIFHSARRRGGSALIRSGSYLLRNQSPAHQTQNGQHVPHTQYTQYKQHANQAYGGGIQMDLHL